jgi:hypothetical protein
MAQQKVDLVSKLLSDRVDIIGDIHGEIEALRTLLARLGVDAERGRADRPLVFVGDLVDRGPDSVAVVELVEHLVKSGIAQCVLGNHEYNLIRAKAKQGNGWFIPHEELVPGRAPDGWHTGEGHAAFPSRQATPSERVNILKFLSTLPVALESTQLRVIHAAWSPAAVEAARSCNSLGEFFQLRKTDRPVVDLTGAPTHDDMENPHRPVIFHEGLAQLQVAAQNEEPAKVLTSGLERPIGPGRAPRYLSGKWRILERSPWWSEDQDPRAVVFGHYWRRRPGADVPGKAEVFDGVGSLDWMGPHKQAFCVDYSVGYRFIARHRGQPVGTPGGLSALRWPERVLVFDDLDETFRTIR